MRKWKVMALASGNLELSIMDSVQEIRTHTKSRMMSGGTLQKVKFWHHWHSQRKKDYQN